MRRLAALTTASILGLTLAPAAPALAVQGPDPLVRELTARAVQTTTADDEAAGPVHRQIVLDPRGDGTEIRRPGAPERTTWRERLADLRRVSYTTPTTADGVIRIAARWQQLRGPRAATAQELTTYIFSPRTDRLWYVEATSRGGVRLVAIDEDADSPDEFEVPVRPEMLELEQTPGAGGEMTIRMSTEWLGVSRLRFATFSIVRDAYDMTRPTRRLHVGAPR